MRNRKRTGWHRYINGINISAFFVVLFVGLPLYWLIASSFKTPANLGDSPPQYRPSTARPYPNPPREPVISTGPTYTVSFFRTAWHQARQRSAIRIRHPRRNPAARAARPVPASL